MVSFSELLRNFVFGLRYTNIYSLALSTKLISMSVRYCSEKCQVDHWNNGGHRKECSKLRKLFSECIVIDKLSASENIRSEKKWSFEKPSYATYDQPFIVKVERSDQPWDIGMKVLHVCDKSGDCSFDLNVPNSDTSKFTKLLEKMKAESTTAGTAIYLSASFNFEGICSIFLHQRKIRAW
jgi:MYND finger